MRLRIVAIICIVALAGRAPMRADQELKVTPELERAVQRGLEFLARTQNPNGSWQGSNGQCSGIVGLAMMAFLAHGEMPDQGRYGQVIRRAVDYMVRTQQSNGLLEPSRGRAMYSHGFATLALAEVYGMVDDPRVGPALKKAVGLIVSAQNSTGGWRYNVDSQDADTTVSGAQMVALRAAANAGIEVPIGTIRKGVAYYKRMFCQGGGFGYVHPSGPNAARSGIGLLVLSLSGAYRANETKATADWLMAGGMTGPGSNGIGSPPSPYTCYYCSQAMFQAGGKYWRMWNETVTPMLISRQQADGSFSGGNYDPGPAGGTAMMLLALEINYNFLPIYQR